MKRTEIRAVIKEYLKNNNVAGLSAKVANELEMYLQDMYPNQKFGNTYKIKCDFEDFFATASISGKVDRCDSFETDFVLDSVFFNIDSSLQVMVWDHEKTVLNLDMNNLTDDDLVDIKHIDIRNTYGNFDIYKIFARVPAKDRGKLSNMIPDDMALELFDTDIPPYAFYHYDGLFYHTTNKGVGNLGGGIGFGGFVREKGTVAQIGNRVMSIGEHAFDGCKNLTEIYISGDTHYVGKYAFSNVPGLKIYCSATSKPDLWDDEWCDAGCDVCYVKK